MFLDVSQAFDNVWHEGLIYKMNKLLPNNVSEQLQSYIVDKKFRVAFEEALSEYHPI